MFDCILFRFVPVTDTSSPAPQGGDTSILSPALAADLEMLSMGNDTPPPTLPTVQPSLSSNC